MPGLIDDRLRYRLRRQHPDDGPKLLQWLNTPELLWELSGPVFEFPLHPREVAVQYDALFHTAYSLVDTEHGELVAHGRILKAHGPVARLDWLIVHPERRNNGLGKILARELCYVAQVQGSTWARLLVAEENNRAIRCYENSGFAVDEGLLEMLHTPDGRQYPLLSMSKPLTRD
jgi:ribosomal protein S18 acetylase RimI-like enzyme